MREDYLFSTHDLFSVLEGQKRKLLEEIEAIEAERLLTTTAEAWVEYFRSKYELELPVIDEAGITVDQGETQVDVSGDQRRFISDRSRPFYIKGTEVGVFIPFTGEGELFRCRPSTWTSAPPRGVVREGELLLPYTVLDHEPEALKSRIDRDVAEVKQYLGWIAHDIGPFNASIAELVTQRIEKRREKLLKDKGLVSGLGFAIRRRTDAPQTFSVPTVRRTPPIARPQGKPGSPPEPALEMQEYEYILKVISNMVTVMERSPKAFHGMKEENLRQHFLVQLNGQYDGQATGETFNYEGKTDILLRIEGRNVFIAECKFWDGPDSVTKAVEQLLSYVSWRDTKTALLVFNRSKNLTGVVQKVKETVKRHPNMLRELPYSSETGYRVTLHHKNDPDRELILTVLVFDIPA
jgi:hypothetical protein